MSKSLQLLKELLEEDKLDIKEVMQVLGYEIVELVEIDVFCEDGSLGYDEVITIRKEYR